MNTLNIVSKQLFRLFLLSGVAFNACNSRPDYTSNIREAEALLWDNPDSSLVILTQLENTKLGVREKSEYLLTRIFHTDINSKVDVSCEGIVVDLADYFDKTHDRERQAIATYLAGKVYLAAGKYQQAKITFSDACKLAGETNHEKLKGLIMMSTGLLNFQKGIYPEALTLMKESLLYIKNDGVHFPTALTGIGKTLLQEDMKDSAYFYFDKALAASRLSGNQERFPAVLYDINNALTKAGEYDRAKSYNLKALQSMGEDYKATVYTNLAETYYRARQTDSAHYFAEKAYLILDAFDMNLKCQLLGLLSRVETEMGNHQESQAYHEQMLDMTNTMQEKISNVSIPEKYRISRHEILLNKMKIRGTLTGIGFISVLVITAITVYWVFRKDKRKTEEARHEVEKRDKMIAYQAMKEEEYLETVKEYCNVLKKIITFEIKIDSIVKKNKKLMNQIVEIAFKDKESQVEGLYVKYNVLHQGYLEKVRQHFKKFPQLDDTDFYVWFLSYIKFKQAEMESGLGCSIRKIQDRNTHMRSVFGLERNADILGFINNEVKRESVNV